MDIFDIDQILLKKLDLQVCCKNFFLKFEYR